MCEEERATPNIIDLYRPTYTLVLKHYSITSIFDQKAY